MINVPRGVLVKLKCSICDGFLQTSPVMVSRNGSQVCGRCFWDLPSKERQTYVREKAFESIAATVIFPCRFHEEGCRHSALFDSTENHESECPYRRLIYDTKHTKRADSAIDANLRETRSNSENRCVLLEENGNLRADVQFCMEDSLKFAIRIEGADQTLSITSDNARRNVSLILGGDVSFAAEPRILSSYLRIDELSTNNNVVNSRLSEHKYETISSHRMRRCINCAKRLSREVYHCNSLHEACGNCKGNFCQGCRSYIKVVPQYNCKNFSVGCRTHQRNTSIVRHEIDCEFNNFECPVEGCFWRGILALVKLHLKDNHAGEIVDNYEVTKQATNGDQDWIMYAYDNIFKCKFYYFKEFVDIVVEYLGAQENARRFKYEVMLILKGEVLKKSCDCLGWNGVALDKGITISKIELRELMGQNKNYKFDFDYTLRIYECRY